MCRARRRRLPAGERWSTRTHDTSARVPRAADSASVDPVECGTHRTTRVRFKASAEPPTSNAQRPGPLVDRRRNQLAVELLPATKRWESYSGRTCTAPGCGGWLTCWGPWDGWKRRSPGGSVPPRPVTPTRSGGRLSCWRRQGEPTKCNDFGNTGSNPAEASPKGGGLRTRKIEARGELGF
jgi:hypothetical protein